MASRRRRVVDGSNFGAFGKHSVFHVNSKVARGIRDLAVDVIQLRQLGQRLLAFAAANAAFTLKVRLWFRRGRLLISTLVMRHIGRRQAKNHLLPCPVLPDNLS
mgnify:CR=1 FL=1